MIDAIGGALGATLGEYFDKKSFGLKKIFILCFVVFYLTFFIYVSIDILFFSDDVGELKHEVLIIFGFSFVAGGVTSSLLTLLHFLSRWANNVNRDKC
jgi:hypothetical protein